MNDNGWINDDMINMNKYNQLMNDMIYIWWMIWINE